MEDKNLEQIISENLCPKENSTFDTDCEKCALYDFADVCRRFTCITPKISMYWALNDGKSVLNNDFITRIRCESAERVFAASKAVILKQYEKKCGR